MCNLHWYNIFRILLHLNCTALSHSESSNFFMYIITRSFSEKVSAGVETGSSDWHFFFKQLQIFEERGYRKCA